MLSYRHHVTDKVLSWRPKHTTMDTKNKVREALELCYRWMEAIYPEKLFPFPAPHDMADGIEARIARQAAKEALAEIDAAPDNQYLWALVNSLCLSREQWTSLIRDLLDRGASLPRPEQMTTETGRNNLAPAAGLTVEEIVRIAGDWFNHVVLDMSAGDDAASDLRTRLTAAIEAKR